MRLLHFALIFCFAQTSWGQLTPEQINAQYETAKIYSRAEGESYGPFSQELNAVDRKFFGYYTESRQKTIDGIVAQALAGGKPSANPEIILTAGTPGAGKTTSLKKLFNTDFVDLSQYLYISADEIMKLIPEYPVYQKKFPELAASLAHKEALYIATLIQEAALKRNMSMIIDTTLSSPEYAREFLQRIIYDFPKYQTSLISVQTSLEISLLRNQQRQSIEHRLIPESVIKKGFVSVRRSVRELDPLFNNVMYINNDNATTITYIRRGSKAEKVNVNLDQIRAKALFCSMVF